MVVMKAEDVQCLCNGQVNIDALNLRLLSGLIQSDVEVVLILCCIDR